MVGLRLATAAMSMWTVSSTIDVESGVSSSIDSSIIPPKAVIPKNAVRPVVKVLMDLGHVVDDDDDLMMVEKPKKAGAGRNPQLPPRSSSASSVGASLTPATKHYLTKKFAKRSVIPPYANSHFPVEEVPAPFEAQPFVARRIRRSPRSPRMVMLDEESFKTQLQQIDQSLFLQLRVIPESQPDRLVRTYLHMKDLKIKIVQKTVMYMNEAQVAHLVGRILVDHFEVVQYLRRSGGSKAQTLWRLIPELKLSGVSTREGAAVVSQAIAAALRGKLADEDIPKMVKFVKGMKHIFPQFYLLIQRMPTIMRILDKYQLTVETPSDYLPFSRFLQRSGDEFLYAVKTTGATSAHDFLYQLEQKVATRILDDFSATEQMPVTRSNDMMQAVLMENLRLRNIILSDHFFDEIHLIEVPYLKNAKEYMTLMPEIRATEEIPEKAVEWMSVCPTLGLLLRLRSNVALTAVEPLSPGHLQRLSDDLGEISDSLLASFVSVSGENAASVAVDFFVKSQAKKAEIVMNLAQGKTEAELIDILRVILDDQLYLNEKVSSDYADWNVATVLPEVAQPIDSQSLVMSIQDPQAVNSGEPLRVLSVARSLWKPAAAVLDRIMKNVSPSAGNNDKIMQNFGQLIGQATDGLLSALKTPTHPCPTREALEYNMDVFYEEVIADIQHVLENRPRLTSGDTLDIILAVLAENLRLYSGLLSTPECETLAALTPRLRQSLELGRALRDMPHPSSHEEIVATLNKVDWAIYDSNLALLIRIYSNIVAA